MRTFVGPLDRYAGLEAPSVLDSILEHRDRLPALRLDCGRDDLLIEENRALHTALDAAGVDHEWHELPGAHDWDYWRAALPAALRFCADQF